MDHEHAPDEASALLVRCFYLNWLPNAAMFAWLNGAWYRIEVKQMSENFVAEEGLAVEHTG